MKAACAAVLALLMGCATVETKVVINAPAKDVQAVLYDFADYPNWNPFLVRVEGTAESGKELYVTVMEEGRPELRGDVTVVTATPTLLSWTGTAMSQMESGTIDIGLPGVLTAKHEFIIEELGPSKTLFSNNDQLSGALVSLYNSKGLQAGLDAMNAALKKRVEQGPK